MTATLDRGASRRWRGPRVSAAADIRQALLDQLAEATRIRFPSPRYRAHPVAFFREILGIEPWQKQIEIVEAVRDHDRVAASSGHKIGKSASAAGTALWFYCSWEDARVVMSSTTSRQVNAILWRELRMMIARGGRCVACKAADPAGRKIPRPCPHSALIEGKLAELASNGLKSSDFREVFGFTAKEPEAVAGTSGARLFYIIDEASGVPQEIYEAIEGNRAGGAKILLLSNPTKTTGEFYDAFHSKRQTPDNPSGYHCIRVSSEDTPNVVQGRVVVPGLATRDWVEEKRREWGEDSPLFRIRVRGEFAKNEDGKIFAVHLIAEAEARWSSKCSECGGAGRGCEECGGTGVRPTPGRLYIGLDPAGPTGSGDETVFAPRRGPKLLALRPKLGLDDDGHLAQLLALIGEFGLRRETPVVVMDTDGPIGSSVYGTLRSYRERNPHAFELVGVRASNRAERQPEVYDRLRDELTANLYAWVRDGGAIPEDAKLAAEMHEFEWKEHVNGRLKVTPKDVIRKALGRSPDRYDALALSCWEPMSLKEAAEEHAKRRAAAPPPEQQRRRMDPYAARNAWRRR